MLNKWFWTSLNLFVSEARARAIEFYYDWTLYFLLFLFLFCKYEMT